MCVFSRIWLFRPRCFQGQFALTETALLPARRRKMDHLPKLKRRNAHCDPESVQFIVPWRASVACAAEHSAEQSPPCIDLCLLWYWNRTSKLCDGSASHLSQHHVWRHLSVCFSHRILHSDQSPSSLVWTFLCTWFSPPWLSSCPPPVSHFPSPVCPCVNFTIGTTYPTHGPPYSTVMGYRCQDNSILFWKMLQFQPK